MRVSQARDAARRWVDDTASKLPGFQGAFFHGSIHDMADADPFPSTSDVDVGVVLEEETPLGKAVRDGIVIEGAAIARSRVESAEQVLADHKLAHSFRRDGVIADPTGHLARVQQRVAASFAEPRWVRARCDAAREHCLHYVRLCSEDMPLHQRAICWAFAEGNLTHWLLVAARRNPTVRRRYAAARDLLAGLNELDAYEALLERLGCAAFSRQRVARQLAGMADAFDAAAPVRRTAFPFGSDIAPAGRGLSVGGTRQLVETGEHREAVFWIVVTWARCLAVLEADAPDRLPAHEAGFRELLADLGVPDDGSVRARAGEIEPFLPRLAPLVERIIHMDN